MGLIGCERRKFYSFKLLLIEIIIFLVLNLFYGFICFKSAPGDWRIEAENAKMMYNNMYEEYTDDYDEKMLEICENELLIIDYSLENNIPYGIGDVKSHMIRMVSFFAVLLIINIVFSVNIFLKEYEGKNWKKLFSTGCEKWKILLAKVYFCVEHLCISMLLFFVITAVVGIAFFGVNANFDIVMCDSGKIITSNIFVKLLWEYLVLWVKCVWYITIISLLVVLFKCNKISLYLVLLLSIFEKQVLSVLKLCKIDKYTPLYYFAGDINYICDNIELFIIICFIYGVLNNLLACLLIEKQEIAT